MEDNRQLSFKVTADRECPNCGNPVALRRYAKCAKCDTPVHLFRRLLVVNIAHTGERWEEAREKIAKAIDRALIERNKNHQVRAWPGSNDRSFRNSDESS